jgi:hypothetical protein
MDFANGQTVKIKLNGLTGWIVGVADFELSGWQYFVEYTDAQGKIDNRWFGPKEIEPMAAEAPKEEVLP